MKFERLEDIAWQACVEGRKAPLTRPAGPGYADPAYALSVEWLATRQAIDPTQLAWGNPTTPSRVLLVCGSARNDGICPGEISKTWRLTELAEQGRAFGVVVHCDPAGAEDHRRNLCDWLEWLGLIDAGAAAKLDRYIGPRSRSEAAAGVQPTLAFCPNLQPGGALNGVTHAAAKSAANSAANSTIRHA